MQRGYHQMNKYVQNVQRTRANLIKNWKKSIRLNASKWSLSPMDILKEQRTVWEQYYRNRCTDSIRCLFQYAEITEGKQMIASVVCKVMGYGLPGGIGAKIEIPTDLQCCIYLRWRRCADEHSELATAVLEELPIILCIFNNEYLGMVRQWQKLSTANAMLWPIWRRSTFPPLKAWNIHSTPDFIRLAELQGKRIRVQRKRNCSSLREAKEHKGTYSNWIHRLTLRKWFILWSTRRNSGRYDYGLLTGENYCDKEWKRWISLCWEPEKFGPKSTFLQS